MDVDSFGHNDTNPIAMSKTTVERGRDGARETRAERVYDGAGTVERAGDGARKPGRKVNGVRKSGQRGCTMVVAQVSNGARTPACSITMLRGTIE